MKNQKKLALDYHSSGRKGKIEVIPTKNYHTQRYLSLAYSPGVAEPCLAIDKNVEDVYKYTAKGNLVAVISNGTAVLGLGDIGPQASKPVMEGKGLLFKIFADIDVFDIEIDATDIDKFVETVKAISPTFGGINLEDIKAPEAFEIERRLKEELSIPVMHDDQHGTAIISAAALKNALELANKDIDKVSMVINGAGAAAISCTRLYMLLGVNPKNIIMCDSKGVIRADRENLTPEKEQFKTNKDLHSLEDALKDADIFIGLSKGNVLSTKMLLSMAKNPIVFAMANPDPEINYDLAMKTREDVIMATGRSDTPNQVNNVLGFPFIFRGALDVRSTTINEEMKMAAVHTLADLAKETVPEEVEIAYNTKNLSFGKDYIIPKPFDNRLITKVSMAVAKAAMESGVAKKPIQDWDIYQHELLNRMGKDDKFTRMLNDKAKENPKKIVFTEGEELSVLKAAQIVTDEGIATPILLGREKIIQQIAKENMLDLNCTIINPKDDKNEEILNKYAESFWNKRQRKGITLVETQRVLRQRNYYGAMMVDIGDAEGVITGFKRSYPDEFKVMINTIGAAKDVKKASSMMLVQTKKGPLFMADTALVVTPTVEDLVNITKTTYKKVKAMGVKPNIAIVSYSNFGSAKSESTQRAAEAVKYLHQNHPEINVDGELQVDFALNSEMLKERFPFSKLANTGANVLIFSNMESGNIAYKILKETSDTTVLGPILLGMNKPVHILQVGASVEEIVNMTSIAVVDAQNK